MLTTVAPVPAVEAADVVESKIVSRSPVKSPSLSNELVELSRVSVAASAALSASIVSNAALMMPSGTLKTLDTSAGVTVPFLIKS